MTNLIEKEVLAKRKESRKAQSKEAMREKISFTKTLKDIEKVESILLGYAQQDDEPSNGRVGALRAYMDSKWKKMVRLLPALKAVDMTVGNPDGSPIYMPIIKRFDGSVDKDD